MTPSVYLGGPITGLSFGKATEWRSYAGQRLAEHNIRGVSPMRGKDYLASLGIISGHGRDYLHMGVLSTPQAVLARDRYDSTRCDVLLCNLFDAEAVSIGSIMEMAWADAHRIPIVAVMPERNHPHDHMFVHGIVGFRVDTLDDALDIVIGMLR